MPIPRRLDWAPDDDEKPGDAAADAWLRFPPLTDQPNMIQMPQVAITGERPGRYADLNSIRQDLGYVKAAAEATVEMISRVGERSDSETLMARALWESAIISYRRSFTSGRSYLAKPRASRPTLNDALAELDTVLVETHTGMLEQANRHFAHRVNRLQDLKVLVYLTAPPEPPRAAGLGPFSITFICPPPDVIAKFLKVLDWLLGLVDTELEALWQEIIDDANTNLAWCYTHAEPRYPDRSPPTPPDVSQSSPGAVDGPAR